tara:strand:- start:2188 stop:2625 length:438 start_codon:yes stop_codon:yes gene_type:complete
MKKKTTKASARKPKTSNRAKAKKLDSMKLTDGKADGKNEVYKDEIKKARDLEELLGTRNLAPFGTYSEATFDEKLKDMTLVDMQELAVKVGIFPNTNRQVLKNRLKKEFVSSSKGKRTVAVEAKSIVDEKHPNYQKIKEIMAEGF